MKKRLILISLLIIIMLLGGISSLVAAKGPDNAQGQAPDQILVKFQPGISEKAKADVHSRYGGKVIDVIPGIDVQVVRIPENKLAEEVRAYKGEASVEFAEPDYIVTLIDGTPTPIIPNDNLFGWQWALDNTGQTIPLSPPVTGTPDADIDAPEAWGVTTGSSDVKIAILDTGIDQNHEDLAGKIVDNKNFTRSRTADDKYGHGTHVAGIAAAITNNGKGVAGVGYNSKLLNVKVLGDTGSGNWSWIASGITWAANNGAKVINMSLGGPIGSSTLKSAVDYAWGKGVVVVAAAGNEDTSAPSYPAFYENVIAVAATDEHDAKASFSNFGSWVEIAAPGVDIVSTFPNHKTQFRGIYNYAFWGGTSMATPHVAGVAALLMAEGFTNAQTVTRIETSVDPTTGFTTAIGRLNAYKAVTP